MADKIVQLQDKDENNLYPVAGSLKQGSVTTSTINDGAVTAQKIASDAVTRQKINMSSFRAVLYDNTNGTNGNITLSDSVINYTHLDIFYRDVDSNYNFVRVFSPNGKRAILSGGYAGSSGNVAYNHKIKIVDISGNTISNSSMVEFQPPNNVFDYNNIYITRVEGWKL